MDSPLLMKSLTMLRLLAFMVLIYLALGLMVERYSQNPNSKVKAFFRILCWPITKPLSKLMRPPFDERRMLKVALGVIGGVWVVLIVLTEVVGRS